MIKEKRNKGLVLYLTLGIVFIIVALGFFLMSAQNQRPTVNYRGESTSASSGDKVLLTVYDIYSKPIADIDGHKTVIWLIRYDNGYVGLEAKENDKDIAKLFNAGNSLRSHPKKLTVKYHNLRTQSGSESKAAIRNYSGAMIGILRNRSDISSHFSFYTYLSLQEVKNDRLALPIVGGIFSLLGFLFIGIAFYFRYKISRAYDELYAAYPELNGNLNLLLSDSLYHDDDLKIIIYKDYLVTYYRGFNLVNLQQVEQVYHRIVRTKRAFITINQQSYLVAIRGDNHKKVNLMIRSRGNYTDDALEPFFTSLKDHFPDIKLGYDRLF